MLNLGSTPTNEEVVRFLIETNGYVTMEPRGGLATVHPRDVEKGRDAQPVARFVIEKMQEGKLLTGKLLGSAVYYELTDDGRRAVMVSGG